ncbi:MAG TPA: hypothetical protein VMT22_05470 [Terriglobales bacterium]|jgi:hypothetical protein|nr:hypothetical protein [Terriglobales bacterium]
MSSIIVAWKGGCAERVRQDDLLSHVRLLAAENAARWKRAPRKLLSVQRILSQERGEGLPVMPDVREFDQEIDGRILVCADVAQEQKKFRAEAARCGISCLQLDSDRYRPMTALKLRRLRIRGLDFRLYDPRVLYPDEDRVSFVFLESETAPFLSGLLGFVHDLDRCVGSVNPYVRAADWYIECPFVHLRYYLESWFDDFLGWIKFFFVPDLHFTRQQDADTYEGLRQALEKLERRMGIVHAREQSFARLIEAFKQEADG